MEKMGVTKLDMHDEPVKIQLGTLPKDKHDFASWSIHMAFIIIFSTLWGFVTREWNGVGKKTLSIVVAGLFILILSTVIIGYGNSL